MKRPVIKGERKVCWLCGKGFLFQYDPFTKEILGDCYYSHLKAKYFLGWSYTIKDVDDFTLKVQFKNKYYKILGFTKIQREIYFFLWCLFNRRKVEYFECPECAVRDDDI